MKNPRYFKPVKRELERFLSTKGPWEVIDEDSTNAKQDAKDRAVLPLFQDGTAQPDTYDVTVSGLRILRGFLLI